MAGDLQNAVLNSRWSLHAGGIYKEGLTVFFFILHIQHSLYTNVTNNMHTKRPTGKKYYV